MKRSGVTLRMDTYERLKQIAEQRHMTMSAVVTQWVWSTRLDSERRDTDGASEVNGRADRRY